MTRRSKWAILIAALLAVLLLSGFLVVRSARFQVWWTLRRVRAREDVTAPERWLRDVGLASRLKPYKAGRQLGALGEPAVALLIRALDDEHAGVRIAAQAALSCLGRRVVPALIGALGNKDPLVRFHAAWALGAIGAEAKDAVPALVRALKDQYQQVRGAAAFNLGWIGPATKEVVPALIAALKDNEPYVRAEAAEALGRIRPVAKDAVPALKKLAESDKDEGVRKAATEALKKIQPPSWASAAETSEDPSSDAKPAVPALINRLKDEEARVRWAAALMLGEIGPAARDALPALKRAAQSDSNEDVRNAAAEALKKIQAASPGSAVPRPEGKDER